MSRGVAIVTGGSRGIGAACARALAADGYDVVVHCRADAAAAESIAQDVRAAGRQAVTVAADLADLTTLPRIFETADSLGPLTCLVNNAGIVDVSQPVADYRDERIVRMFTVNAMAPIALAREAANRMTTGNIVNISSTASRLASAGKYVDYAASKAAIDVFTIGLARELAPKVRVNAVRPGIVDTEIHASGGEPDRAWQVADQIPMRRPGAPDEIAAAVAWLCSDAASYVTGAILDVSGGR